MASITVPNFDTDLLLKLRQRAIRNGRSLSEETQLIFSDALADETLERPDPPRSLVDSAREIFGPLGGVDLELPSRWPEREPSDSSSS